MLAASTGSINSNLNKKVENQNFDHFLTQQNFHLESNQQYQLNSEQLDTSNLHSLTTLSSICSTSSSSSSSGSSMSATSLLMPLIHESSDLLNCDINLTHLQHLQQMDEDEDYVEHDLNDTDNSDDDDDSDEEDSDNSEADDDDDDDDDDTDDENEADHDDDSQGTGRKLKKSNKNNKSNNKKRSKSSRHNQNSRNSRLNKDGTMSKNFEASTRSVINEQNFVTITRKCETTLEIQNGKKFKRRYRNSLRNIPEMSRKNFAYAIKCTAKINEMHCKVYGCTLRV